MHRQGPFYNRIMARLSKKPLADAIKNKLKLSALDDVLDAQLEGSNFLDLFDQETISVLQDEYNEFANQYYILENQAASLMERLEDFDNQSSEISSVIEYCVQAKENYMDLANELGIDPSENSEWQELANIVDELELVQDDALSFDYDYNLMQQFLS